jgi:Sec-independent protein translocase protein TatA
MIKSSLHMLAPTPSASFHRKFAPLHRPHYDRIAIMHPIITTCKLPNTLWTLTNLVRRIRYEDSEVEGEEGSEGEEEEVEGESESDEDEEEETTAETKPKAEAKDEGMHLFPAVFFCPVPETVSLTRLHFQALRHLRSRRLRPSRLLMMTRVSRLLRAARTARTTRSWRNMRARRKMPMRPLTRVGLLLLLPGRRVVSFLRSRIFPRFRRLLRKTSSAIWDGVSSREYFTEIKWKSPCDCLHCSL